MDTGTFGVDEVWNNQDDATLNRASPDGVTEPDSSPDPFHLLFQQAPVGYAALDGIGLIRAVNETFCRMTERGPDYWVGRSFSQCVAGVEHGVFLAHYRALFRNPQGQSLEALIQRGRGTTFLACLQGVKIDAIPAAWQGDNRPLLLLAITDSTVCTAAQEKLRSAAAVFEVSADPIMITDVRGVIKAVNNAFANATGYEPQEVVGRHSRILRSGRMPTEYYTHMWRTLAEVGYWEGEIWNRRKNGTMVQEWLTITAAPDAEHQAVEYVAVFSDIAHRRLNTEEIHYLAYYDSLTRLPNRNLLLERLGQAIRESGREPRKLALLFIALDHFKDVNDTLGYGAGDRLLQETARRLLGCVRISDTVARQVSDEFAILLRDIERSTDAAHVAVKILGALAQPFELDDHAAHIGAGIGITLFPDDGKESAQLFRNAELAMYRAKEAGANTFQFFEPAMTEAAQARRDLEADFRHALECRNEFALFLQPIVDLRDHRINGFEALSRWSRRRQESVPPDRFIPLAEESGLIHEFSRWMLTEACRCLAMLKAEKPHLHLAVNPSGRQIPDRLSLDWLCSTVEEHQLSPSDLTLEITEGVLLTDSPATRAWLAEARRFGFRIALDDFGTGYSSLAYLKSFPLDQIKIDKSFIRDIESQALDKALVRAILAMSGELGLNVVAEGIETDGQLCLLREMGCSYGQGYRIAKPMPAQDAIAWMNSLTH